jgi:hypothetical protein
MKGGIGPSIVSRTARRSNGITTDANQRRRMGCGSSYSESNLLAVSNRISRQPETAIQFGGSAENLRVAMDQS